MTTAAEPGVDVVVDRDVMVPMRDGVRLATDVTRPAGEGRHPVLLMRLPYGKTLMDRVFLDPTATARRGYVVVAQDSRGRFGSEGEWVPFHSEIDDGHDAVEWCAGQQWSDGRVGLCSGSYIGATQWLAAMAQPPHLVTMAPATTASDFHDHWVWHTGGAFELAGNVGWAISVSANIAKRLGVHEPTVETVGELREVLGTLIEQDPEGAMAALGRLTDVLRPWWSHRPLRDLPPLRGLSPWFADWLDHADRDPYWERIDIGAHHDRIDVPALHTTGWFDCFLAGSIANFTGMRRHAPTERARRGQKLIVGPWFHGPFTTRTTHVGEVDFGSQAGIDFQAVQWRWFDHWLKGADTGMLDEPPVRLFVMGENAWRDEREWPLARTRWTPWYLHGDGGLSTEPPADEPPDAYTYDPADPVPTLGGCLLPYGITPGMFDQRSVEDRPDVLVYTSAPLEKDLEVTGPVSVELWASSSAVDTDFTAKLVDVHPDGRAFNLCDGIVRARYRASRSEPALLTPGAVYAFRIDLWATSNVFRAGHRLRLHVSSSSFPHFDPNPNTGLPLGGDEPFVTARQRVFHDPVHPSHVMLPVIPR